MIPEPHFTEQEYESRLAAVRERMAGDELDLLLISTPENIFYLTGLDHWGYFAPHLLIVPADDAMVLITRSMEAATVANQVKNVRFIGHADHESAADVSLRWLKEGWLARPRAQAAAEAAVEIIAGEAGRRARIGIEKWSSGLPYALAEQIMSALPDADWVDVSTLVDGLRRVKSPAEQACLREAARISEVAMEAAIDAVSEGVTETDVAARCHHAMIAAGGTFPGFGPFIRPHARLGEEHTSWGAGSFSRGDAVFIELSGCVRRYHAPMGRLVHVGSAPQSAHDMGRVCLDAFDAAVAALVPGTRARDVYAAWQGVVDGAGLSHYRRHHCGYLVGIGFPPSWTGGNRVTGLRSDSDLEIRAGMSFHMLSWLMGTGRGDHFVSNTVLLTDQGPEVLTTTPRDVRIK